MKQPEYDPNWRRRLYRDLLEPIFLHFGVFILGLLAVAALLIMLFRKMIGE